MRWTAKLPALILGIVALIAGLFVSGSKWRYAALGGAVLFGLGAGFIGYSLTIKEWCVPNTQSAFSSAFSSSFRGCLRMKGWIEF